MTDIPTILTGAAAVLGGLTPIGGGVAFVWGKIEGRFKAIEADLKTANKQLAECRARDQKKDSLIAGLVFALRLLAAEVSGSDPKSPIIAEVRKILKEAGAHTHAIGHDDELFESA